MDNTQNERQQQQKSGKQNRSEDQDQKSLRPETFNEPNSNPESLAGTDKEQRLKGSKPEQHRQDIPTGNEPKGPRTEGTESGMGE